MPQAQASEPLRGHRHNEERSLRLHRAVGEKLRRDPEVLAKARARVRGWQSDGSVHPRYADAWDLVLSLSPEEISERLSSTRTTSYYGCVAQPLRLAEPLGEEPRYE